MCINKAGVNCELTSTSHRRMDVHKDDNLMRFQTDCCIILQRVLCW